MVSSFDSTLSGLRFFEDFGLINKWHWLLLKVTLSIYRLAVLYFYNLDGDDVIIDAVDNAVVSHAPPPKG